MYTVKSVDLTDNSVLIFQSMTIEQKWAGLKAIIAGMDSAIIAFSGGVDSSLLLKAAAEVMGPRVIAVTADSETYPPSELAEARELAGFLNVDQRILRTNELASENFASNPRERCYYCKKELFGKLKQIADAEKIAFILDGSNLDDLKDYRPGSRAAAEYGVRSPLKEAGFTKDDVRACARMAGLHVWDKPSLACLSSRIPYGTRITPEILKTVQFAEDSLRLLGLRQVRVRHHGDTARIEVNRDDFNIILGQDASSKIVDEFKRLGYTYVCLDLEGYRTGSMNEGQRQFLKERE